MPKLGLKDTSPSEFDMRMIVKGGWLLGAFLCPLCIPAQNARWHSYTPIPLSCQERTGEAAADDGTIGADLVQIEQGLVVASVVPGGPADKAGIRTRNHLLGAHHITPDEPGFKEGEDRITVAALDLCTFQTAIRHKVGSREWIYVHEDPSDRGQGKWVPIEVAALRDVEPKLAVGDSSVSQRALGGKGFVIATLSQNMSSPGKWVNLDLVIDNQLSSLVRVDEAKVFLLDNRGHQVDLQSFAEWKNECERAISEANRMLATPIAEIPYQYPPPPPPPSHYTISGTTTGSYTVTEMGQGSAYVAGRSSTNLTVRSGYDIGDQIGYAMGSLSALINNIRIARQNRQIRQKNADEEQELREIIRNAQREVTERENWCWNPSRPLAPGENHRGIIIYRPSDSDDFSSLKAVVTLTDLSTGREEFVTFHFQP